jgi:hypothetical protein
MIWASAGHCGKAVFRIEGAVSFGLCWWHLGCSSCLFCNSYQVTQKPTGITRILLGNPHCESLFKPPQMEHQCIYVDRPKPLDVIRQKPVWISLLPSNRKPHVRPLRHSAIQRRSTVVYFSSTLYSSPFSTPTENCRLKIRMVIHYQLLTSSHSRKVYLWNSADDFQANGCRHSRRHSAVKSRLKVMYYQPTQYRIHLMHLYYGPVLPKLVVMSHINTARNTNILEGYQTRLPSSRSSHILL